MPEPKPHYRVENAEGQVVLNTDHRIEANNKAFAINDALLVSRKEGQASVKVWSYREGRYTCPAVDA